MSDAGYRDFRPTVHLAMALFSGRRGYANVGVWDLHREGLDVVDPVLEPPPYTSCDFGCGGYKILRNGEVSAVLRPPYLSFDPVRLMRSTLISGLAINACLSRMLEPIVTLLRLTCLGIFVVPLAIILIQFDDRDQMPRLGGFFTEITKAEHRYQNVDNESSKSLPSRHVDANKVSHERK